MHVLFVTHYFAPSEGAAASRLTRLAQALHQQGHRVTVLTALPHYPQGRINPPYRGKLWVREDQAGIRVIYSGLWATPSARISRRLLSQLSVMPLALLRGLALPRPDVTLIEAQPIFTGLVGRLLSRLKGVPYVLNVSDLWPDHLLSVGALRATSPIYRLARYGMDSGYRGAAAIVTLSPAWSRQVIAYAGGHAAKVHMIYRGVDTALFRPGLDTAAFRARHGLTAEKLVTFIGTFATQYDMAAFFAAAAAYQARPEVQFVLIGTGSQREQVEAQLAAEALPNVRWLDWIDHADMPLAWNASYLTLWALRDVPLYYGTIPAKLYEALAAGTPIVAAMGGEGAAILAASGGGLTVAPGDTAGLVALVGRLLDDPALRATCSQRARAYAEQHLTFTATTRQYETVLAQAAQQGRAWN